MHIHWNHNAVIGPLNDTYLTFWELKHVVYISPVINRIKINLELVTLKIHICLIFRAYMFTWIRALQYVPFENGRLIFYSVQISVSFLL